MPSISFRAISLLVASSALCQIAMAQDGMECTDGPEGRTCKITQPLVNGALVSTQMQQNLGLVTVGGGCSGTLINRFWVLTADHCVTTDGAINGPSAPLANIPITAAWSALTVTPSRLVRNWGASGLDIALIYLGAGDFGKANVQLFFVGDVDTSMTLTKFGRGIFAYASAGPPAVPAQQDGQYRTAVFKVGSASATAYSLPNNAANQVGNGGDSGGPDLVTAQNGVTLGIAGVQSTCVATSRVPGMPSGWAWVTAISSCASASISTARFDILQITQEAPIAARNSCASEVGRGPTSVAWGWDDGSSQTSIALFKSAGTKFQERVAISRREGGWGDDVKWFAGDFDNDGRSDIGAAWNNGGNNTLTVRRLTDAGGVSATHWASNAGTWSPTSVWLPGDFNSDGRTDVAVVWNDGGQVSIGVFLSDGTKFGSPTQWSQRDGGWGGSVKWFVGDFNNDRRTDIGSAWNNNGVTTLTVRQSTGSTFTPVHWSANAGPWADVSAFVAGDFNDDKRTDVARLWNDQGLNSISVSLSNGTGFAAPAAWSVRDGGWISGDAVKWFPGDFNGDGRADIGAAWDDEHLNTLTVRQSTGNAFVTAHWATKAGGWRNSATWCSGQFKPTGVATEVRADSSLTPRVSQPAIDVNGLAAKGEAIANQDPLSAELRRRQPDDAARRGFDIGMAAAEGQTAPGPGKDRIRDSLPAAEQGGFNTAVAFSLERNSNADFAARGAAIVVADPSVAAARAIDPDVFYWLGFDIATGIFGDPALGAQGNTATGPGSMKIRDSLSAAGQRGFNAAVALHLSRNYTP